MTLAAIRQHIERLATDDGAYYLVCGRTGERPVPATGLRFETRATAAIAGRATEAYRAILRGYDPQLPVYDVIVCQVTARQPEAETNSSSGGDPAEWTLQAPVLANSSPAVDRKALLRYGHRIAAVLFEALSDFGFDEVETAVMDAYCEQAATTSDPDELCLHLLERMALECSNRLAPETLATVIAAAATRLEPNAAARPVDGVLSRLERTGLVGTYSRTPWRIDLEQGKRAVEISVSEYALTAQDGELPVLPIVVELYRCEFDWQPSRLDVTKRDDGWQWTIVCTRDETPSDLARVPIDAP
jgi:hypothetical protein